MLGRLWNHLVLGLKSIVGTRRTDRNYTCYISSFAPPSDIVLKNKRDGVIVFGE